MNKKIRLNKLLLSLALITAFTLFDGCYSNYVRSYTPVTVSEIVDMSKKGISPKEIIDMMKNSHTVYRLKASQLTKLKDEGVSDKVLNYMQKTYLAAVQKDAELESYNYWWPGYDGYWYGGPMFGWPDWGWGIGFGGDNFYGDIDEDEDED